MRYIVAGQSDAKGVIGDDSADLNVYYELGWEVTLTTVIAKTLLKEGSLFKTDTIVTAKDRAFFYSSLFDNVIDWHEFKQIEKSPEDEIHFLPKDIDNWSSWENRIDPELVCNFDLIADAEKRFNVIKPFGIYCIRLRDHCSWRNSNIDVARSVISRFINECGIDIFVMGQNSSFLSEELGIPNISLQEYASLMGSKHCKFCVSPMSGIIQIANFCGHENLYNFIFDHNSERGPTLENHPLFMGNNINLKNVKNIIIPGQETEEQIFELYEENVVHS